MNDKFKINTTIECDLLIIGAGGAGLRCAAEVLEKRPETKVLAVTKVAHPQKSHTSTAQGGMGAVDPQDPSDRPGYHMFDTWKGSDCMADQNVIRKIIEASWDEIAWLENRGLHFSRDQEGRLSKRTFGGHTLRFGEGLAYRAVFEADRTGKGIIDTVWGEAVKRGITFLNQAVATELLFQDQRCVGALLYRQKDGQLVQALAKITVLSTGGSGQVFRVTTNCRGNTGDGLALVLDAGLPVMDPEAVQFHPTGIVGPGILASEALRGEGGILRNSELEPFMERYAPKMKDLAPRDVVARAIEREIREGRGIIDPDYELPHVWIDLRHLSDYVHEVKLREISSFFKKYVNRDPKTELCPIRPSNHYHMGGIPTNEWGEVMNGDLKLIPGLFAVGECASASFHGFNRLATNSLLELITMGRFAGERILTQIREMPVGRPQEPGTLTLARLSRYFSAKGQDSLGDIRQALRDVMTEKASVFRTEAGLLAAIGVLTALKDRSEKTSLSGASLIMNPELIERWELDNLLTVAMIIAQAALARRESRGAHYREDFPERSHEFNDHTLLTMTEYGKISLGRRPVDMSLHEAGGEFSEKFGLIERKY